MLDLVICGQVKVDAVAIARCIAQDCVPSQGRVGHDIERGISHIISCFIASKR